MYGPQTVKPIFYRSAMFENDVKMYGTQTKIGKRMMMLLFENDVKMYGPQTAIELPRINHNV